MHGTLWPHLRIEILFDELIEMTPKNQEVFGAGYVVVDAIVNGYEEFASHCFGNETKLVEVHAAVMEVEDCLDKSVDLQSISFFLFELFLEGSPIPQVHASFVFFILDRGNVSQDCLYFTLTDLLIAVDIVAFEGDKHLLLEGSHQHLEHEQDKLIVVDALVAVGVHLADQAISEDFRQTQILLRPLKR